MSATRLRLRRALASVLALAGAAFSASAAADESALRSHVEQAVAAYEQAMAGDERGARLAAFHSAERHFRAAVEAGARNADLYANLGNAALQGERLGPAVLAYRRALLLDPHHARARQNLAHARTLLPDWVPTPAQASVLDSFFFWHRTLSREARSITAALFFALAALLGSAAWLRRSSGLRTVALLPALLWAALQLSVLFDPGRNAVREGVVIVPEASARAADSINAPRRFSEPLPGGTEVAILEDRGGWLHVELQNGRDAWVTSASVERVAEPSPGD